MFINYISLDGIVEQLGRHVGAGFSVFLDPSHRLGHDQLAHTQQGQHFGQQVTNV